MKRFLEYMEDVRRGRALSEGKFDRPYRLEKADLTDGRKYVELREADFKDAIRNGVGTRFFGPARLQDCDRRFAAVGNFVALPPAKVRQLEPEPDDTYQFGVVDAGEWVTCTPPNSAVAGGAGLIGLFAKEGWFKRAYVFQMSFNECVSLALASKAKTVNPMMLFKLLNSERGVFEDEGEERLQAAPGDYSRADVLKFAQNPKSHFNDPRHTARREAYRQQIVDEKGELGEVVVVSQARMGTTTQYDNLLTDRNWIVSTDPRNGNRVADLMKVTVRKLVQTHVFGRKTPKDMSAYGKWMPRERLFAACDDEVHGRVV